MADTLPSVGGTGKGASGAASFFGDNGRGSSSPVAMFAALGGLLVVGLIVWLLVKK